MHDTLAKIVQLEADKLLLLAQGQRSLAGDSLEALEQLCRCVRALRVMDAKGAAVDDVPEADDLALIASSQK